MIDIARPSGSRKQPVESLTWTKHTVAIDNGLAQRAKELAQRQRTTFRELVEQGLSLQVEADTAGHSDSTLAPLIERILLERHRRLEAGLRTMMARVAYELLRSQYVWFNFMAEAGVQPSKVSRWHEEGWGFAVKEFKRQGGDSRFDDAEEDDDP